MTRFHQLIKSAKRIGKKNWHVALFTHRGKRLRSLQNDRQVPPPSECGSQGHPLDGGGAGAAQFTQRPLGTAASPFQSARVCTVRFAKAPLDGTVIAPAKSPARGLQCVVGRAAARCLSVILGKSYIIYLSEVSSWQQFDFQIFSVRERLGDFQSTVNC